MRRRTFLAAGLAVFARLPVDSSSEWTGVERVVAVGDVHGDKDALVAVLRMADVVDDRERWIGGRTYVVQIGDVPARGPQTRQAFDFLMRLEKEAEETGGRIHAIIGNHDAGVIYGDLRSILPAEYEEFRGQDSEARLAGAWERELESRRKSGRFPVDAGDLEALKKQWFEIHPPGFVEHREAFSPAGYYGSWIRRRNALIKINDTLFVHGGISPKYALRSRSNINETVQRELADPDQLLPGMSTDPLGPLWYRGLSEDPTAELEPHLQSVLDFHGVRRLVVGHAVTRSAVLPFFGSRVVNVDIGLSRFYGRPPACLLLEGKDAFVLHRDVRIPLPGSEPAELLEYFRAVEKADEKPSPVTRLIEELQSQRERFD